MVCFVFVAVQLLSSLTVYFKSGVKVGLKTYKSFTSAAVNVQKQH